MRNRRTVDFQARAESCAIVGVLHKSNVFCVKEGSHSTLGLIGELGTMGSSGMMDDGHTSALMVGGP